MTTDRPSSTLTAAQTAELLEEVSTLRDLFQRRLLEDKAKNRLYEELYEQLRLARGGLADQLLAPLFRELLLVVDRVSRLTAPEDAGLESVRAELLELLERWGVSQVPQLHEFNPEFHEAVGVIASVSLAPGTVVEVLRPGFRMGSILLRPERVLVSAPPESDHGERDQTGSSAPSDELLAER